MRGRAGSTARWLAASAALLLIACDPPKPRTVESVVAPLVAVDLLDAGMRSLLESNRNNVATRPDSADAWGRYGQALEAAEFLVEALKCYERAAALQPGSARWWHLTGLACLQDRPEAALQALNRAADLAGSTNEAPRLRLIQALVERGQLAEAANQAQRLLSSAPNHPAARLELARVRFQEGRGGECEALLAPCLTNAHTARSALVLLSQAKARAGDAATAAALALRAQSMPKPFDWPDPYVREVQTLRLRRETASERANGLLQQRRFAEAEALLSDTLKQFPDDAESLLLMGRLRLQQQRCDEAIGFLQQHLNRRSDSVNGLVQMGMARYCQSEWLEAAANFEHAAALKPDFAQAHYNLGLARSRAGNLAGAVTAMQTALRCNPGDPDMLLSLAEHQLAAGQLEAARAAFVEAQRVRPNHPRLKSVGAKLAR